MKSEQENKLPFTGIPEAILSFPENGAIFESTIPVSLFRGDKESPVALIYGPNAAGKSFFMRIVRAIAKEEGFDPLPVTMAMRTESGFHRCFMYSAFGDQEESTGLNSFIAVKGAMRTACSADRKSLVIFDEPDIGMSEGYAEAMGEWIAREEQGLHAGSAGIILCTHSKALVRRYMECSRHMPHGINLYDDWNGKGIPPAEWINQRETFSVDMLENLGERAHAKRRLIEDFLTDRKSKTSQGSNEQPKGSKKARATSKKAA